MSALQGKGIAITRPVGQASKLSALIQAQGGTAISFPLIDIAPLADYSAFQATIQQLPAMDWAIFISSNAVQQGMPRVLQQFQPVPERLQFAAIGPVTAQELLQFGVKEVLVPEGRFDSESLLSLPQMQAVQGQQVMIFRGVGGREVLADTLRARGAIVTFAECYRRVNPQANSEPLRQLWQNKRCHAIVVTSAEAMRYLLQMTHHGQDDWLRDIAICVNHARIAEEAQQLAGNALSITVAEAPGDAAMLACLQRALQR